MADAGFFKGTSTDQDTRFKDKEKALLKSMKFPPELDKKVDMRKVELSVMRPWIANKVVELLGFEDEVVIEYVNGLLEDDSQPIVDPKRMMINLTGFLESQTSKFMAELWTLLLSAQASPLKVPAIFIEQKKEEMKKRDEEDRVKAAEVRRRQEVEDERERKLAEIRERERGAGGGQGRGRGGYRGRDSGWGSRGRGPPPRDYGRYRSPPPRRRSPSPRRGYSPRRRSRSYSPPPRRRRHSPSYSRSPSPRPRRRRRSPSYSDDESVERNGRRGGGGGGRGRSRSRSETPPTRRPERRGRSYSRSETPPARYRSGGNRRRSSTPPPPRQKERERQRSASPPRRARYDSPPAAATRRRRDRSYSASSADDGPRDERTVHIKGRAAAAAVPQAVEDQQADVAVEPPKRKVTADELKERLLREKARASMKGRAGG